MKYTTMWYNKRLRKRKTKESVKIKLMEQRRYHNCKQKTKVIILIFFSHETNLQR